MSVYYVSTIYTLHLQQTKIRSIKNNINNPLCLALLELSQKSCCVLDASSDFPKEVAKRRHGEPIKFLFLPKISLLGSQASTGEKIGYDL